MSTPEERAIPRGGIGVFSGPSIEEEYRIAKAINSNPIPTLTLIVSIQIAVVVLVIWAW